MAVTVGRRRTKVEITRARESDWLLLGHEGYAFNGTCTRCGDYTHVRGKRKTSVRCRPCHMGGAA